MKKALAYRLFRVGRMPPALQAIAAQGGVLVSGEGALIRFDSRGLRMPGRYTSRGVKLYVGAVVVTGERVAVSLGRQPVLDNDYSTDRSGPLTSTVDGTPLVGTRHVQLSSAEAATLTRFA